MTAKEHQLIQVLTVIIGEICKHDNRCKVNEEGFSKIRKENPIVKENNLTLKYDNLQNEMKIISKIAKEVDNYRINDLVNAIRAYLKNPSDKTWVKVIGFYSELKKNVSERFTKAYSHTTKIGKNLTKELKSLVKSITGREDIVLSIQELKTLKEKNPEKYLKYVNMFNTMLDSVKTEIQKYLMNKRNHKDTITGINNDLVSKGMEPIFHLRKYDDVKMDLNFNLYNTKDVKLACKLPLYRVIVIPNPQYDPEKDDQYVFKYKAVGANIDQFCYTVNYKKSKTLSKYENVDKLMKMIPKMRKHWLKDLTSNNIAKQQLGAACEIIYQTAMRVGTKGNQTNGKETYGLLTLKVKHVKCNPKQVTFDYIGKAGIHHVHTLKDPKIAKVICKLIQGKSPNDRVFSITPEQLNKYLVDELHSPVTIHKFRTLKGTQLAYEKLIKDNPCNKMKSDAEKLNYLKQISLEIGKELGHVSGEKITGETALKNYIDPGIIKQYFEKCGLKMPKKFQQLTEEDVYNAVPDYPQWPGYYQAEPAHKILTYYTKYF